MFYQKALVRYNWYQPWKITYRFSDYIQKSTKSGHRDTERWLDFVMRLDEITGKPIGVAWKNFGYKGPKFHDRFLYGEPNLKMEMTGMIHNIYY